MTNEELEIIKKRCNLATKAPWQSFIEGRDHTSGSDFNQTGGMDNESPDIELIGATKQDQDFIASARQDVPRLIEEIHKLKAQIRVNDL